jgi:methylenetetrahydrofolate dehydrogenase (NADP+)/methenyltetrahydrofolate cyclohydrolase
VARIINGTELSEVIRAEIAEETAAFHQDTGVRPGLATVLVGSDPASQVYVRMKGKAAEQAGFNSREIVLPEATPEE